MLAQAYEKRVDDGDEAIKLLTDEAFNRSFQALLTTLMEEEFEPIKRLTLESLDRGDVVKQLESALIRRAVLNELLQGIKHIAYTNQKRVNL